MAMAGARLMGASLQRKPWTSWSVMGRLSLPLVRPRQAAAAAAATIKQELSTSQCRQTVAQPAKSPTDQEPELDALPFEAIPGPKGLPLVGTLFEFWKNFGSMTKHIRDRAKEFGPIYKEKTGPFTTVVVTDADVIRKISHQEGRYPVRPELPSWAAWREQQGHNKGVFLARGPEWRRMRTVLEKQMMRPRNVAEYAAKVNDVNDDFVQRVRRLRRDDGLVVAMDNEMFRWSLESIASLMYETRLGGLSDNPDAKAMSFIQAVNDMFTATEYLTNLPPSVAKWFAPRWTKQHGDAWTIIFNTGQELIDKKIAELLVRGERGEEVGGFLATVIGRQELSPEDLYANVSELMAAAVDTTSNTMQMVLNYVSRDPEVQDKIREELNRVAGPPPTRPTQENLNNMPYLRAVVKETQRLFHAAIGSVRSMPTDLVLGGYKIPAGTFVFAAMFLTSMDPANFPEPEAFRPERWMREGDERAVIHPFASLPFGFGQRGCVGRRIAEMELQLLAAKLCEQFDMVSMDKQPIELATRLVVIPKTPVSIRFNDRRGY